MVIFEIWSNGTPDGWGRSFSSVEKETLLDKNCAKIGRDILIDGFINTSVLVSKDRQIAFSFLYAYVGEGEIRDNLSFKLRLIGGGKTYYLGKKWCMGFSRIINYLPKQCLSNS